MKAAGMQAMVLILMALVPASWYWLKTGSADEALAPYEVAIDDPRVEAWHPLWIDARARGDYDIGHVTGAISLTEDGWDQMLPAVFEAWKPDRAIIVYCSADCEESEKVAMRLRDLGMDPVYYLKGGYEAWKRAL
jgi:rhodanese-related sulfurtransferase